jgi:hypothetical protein
MQILWPRVELTGSDLLSMTMDNIESSQASFNTSKVAILIENRPKAILVPLILHFISVVPADWRFRFMGSDESVALVNASAAIRHQVAIGKLDVSFIPSNMTSGGWWQISKFLTTLWLY